MNNILSLCPTLSDNCCPTPLQKMDKVELRACLKIPWGPVFVEKAGWRGATREHPRSGAVTEEQRSQPAFSAKTLRAAGLLPAASVGSAVTARCEDAPTSPPWLQPKSLAAGLYGIFRQALRAEKEFDHRIVGTEFISLLALVFVLFQAEPDSSLARKKAAFDVPFTTQDCSELDLVPEPALKGRILVKSFSQ